MKISILVVCYNQEKFIRESVASILAQKIPFEHEIIVADDCSTDATLSIVKEILERSDLQYKILENEINLGISKNYQRGFAACRGEYIAVMEGDDYWEDPFRLTKHVAFLDDNPNCVLSFNRLKIYNQLKGTIKDQNWTHPEDVEFITTSMMALKNRIGNLSACVFRRSALQKLRSDLYDLGIADWMLGMAIGEHGTLAKLKEPMSVYRVHENGKWSGRSRKDQVTGMIQNTIPKYDQYLNLKYHAEFEEHKKNLHLNLLRDASIKHKIVKHTPTFVKKTLSFLLPEFVKTSIIKIIQH
jgi:glycosyltransferase involved in cell wall biosynthesis